MELSYQQLEATLTGHFRIHPDRRGTFKARIKQLQRMGFPPGVNTGRGVKMIYTAEHLLKLATVFELIQCPGLPAERAVNAVEGCWKHFSAAFGLAAANHYRRNRERHVYARLVIQGLAEIQVAQQLSMDGIAFGTSSGIHVVIEDERCVQGSLTGRWPLAFCAPILRVSDLFEQVMRHAQQTAGVADPWNDIEVFSWLPNPSEDDLASWLVVHAQPDEFRLNPAGYPVPIEKADPGPGLI